MLGSAAPYESTGGCAKSGVWLQARHTNVKVFLAAFPDMASKISAVMSERVFPRRPCGDGANYPCTDLYRHDGISRHGRKQIRQASAAGRMHLAAQCHSVAGRKSVNCGQKTAPNLPRRSAQRYQSVKPTCRSPARNLGSQQSPGGRATRCFRSIAE